MAAYLVGTRGTARHALALGLAVTVSHTLGILALGAIVVGAGNVLPPEEFQRVASLLSAATVLAIGIWLLTGQIRRRVAAPDDDEHEHGGLRHRHVAADGVPLTWRSLFALGLAGGVIPSTNALLILLATIVAGRTEYGVVLVVAFGLGMATVMTGVGLTLVYARELVDRLAPSGRLARTMAFAPMGAAVVVLGLGLVLAAQAVSGTPVL